MGAEKESPKKFLTRTAMEFSSTEGAGRVIAGHYASAAGQSMEQLYCPIQIMKNKTSSSPTPGFQSVFGGTDQGSFGNGQFVGPSATELDPYFTNILDGKQGAEFLANCDYKIMVHEDGSGGTTDLNINKIDDKRKIEKIRINAHRTPMILSGWGYDLGDRPRPSMGGSYPNSWKVESSVPYDRTTWKTGPLAVAWDDERQVWSGGPQIVCGIALGKIKAPKSPCKPTFFSVQLLRKTSDNNGFGPSLPYSDLTNKLDKTKGVSDRITVVNRDPSLEQDYMENAMFIIAIRLNYEWLPLWVGCPEDDIPIEKATCLQ
jgi:hypothetical protein